MAALMFFAFCACAQEAEPRSYSNLPVGLNFVIAGVGLADGKIAFDPALPIADAKFHSGTALLAYARALDVGGKSSKFDIVLSHSAFSGHALAGGLVRQREMTGSGDPRFRFSMNFYGAPALSRQEFVGYRQDLIVGASLQLTAPLGQYDNGKLVNIGNNRWSFKPELGVSKAWGAWVLEIAPSATIYTDNTDFNTGGRFSQAPIYALQGHTVYTFPSGIWAALDIVGFAGGRTTISGVRGNNMQRNTRSGLTLALPIDRSNSVKLNASTGTSTRTGSDYNAIGIAWQYRWFDPH